MKKKVIIIGAGPAGLTTAYELLTKSKNYEVIILEESKNIGGLSKTINYKGNRMDIGGHRFFSKEKRVNHFWEELMPLQGKPSYDDKKLKRKKELKRNGPNPEIDDIVFLKRNRISRIYYMNNFFDYPLSINLKTISNLGFKKTFLCGISYLKSLFFKREEKSLEDFYINRFGKKLYKLFFEEYTEKVWGRHPKDINPEWGKQRVKGLSIISIIKDILKISKKKETSLIEEFIYPKYGPGQFWEVVANRITKAGGKIVLNQKVTKINVKNKRIISLICNNDFKNEIKADVFISSMPIKDLVLSLNAKVPKKIFNIASTLPYRDFISIGILVSKLNLKNNTSTPTLGNIIPDCWIYVQDKNVKLGRIQIYNNWSPYLVKDPNNTVWIGLEYFCQENDELWRKTKKEFKDLAIKELINIGVIESEEIIDYHIEKEKKAYPAYFDSYSSIKYLRDYLDNYDNLYCIGRNGQHRYNNMDHSMMTGFFVADHLLFGNINKKDIWNINTEEDYNEEKKC